MRAMSTGATVRACNADLAAHYDRKFAVFLKMYEHQMEYRALMME